MQACRLCCFPSRLAPRRFLVCSPTSSSCRRLGVFDDEEEAAHVYDKVCVEEHGAAAITNFPAQAYELELAASALYGLAQDVTCLGMGPGTHGADSATRVGVRFRRLTEDGSGMRTAAAEAAAAAHAAAAAAALVARGDGMRISAGKVQGKAALVDGSYAVASIAGHLLCSPEPCSGHGASAGAQRPGAADAKGPCSSPSSSGSLRSALTSQAGNTSSIEQDDASGAAAVLCASLALELETPQPSGGQRTSLNWLLLA